MALIGNTVKLRCEFKTFTGVYADPTNITLKIYDSYMNQIGSMISINNTSQVDIGIYEYAYTIPSDVRGLIYYEFCGTLEGNPIVGRGKINITWV